MSDSLVLTDEVLNAAAAQVGAARNNSAKTPVVKGFFDEATFTITYVVHDPASGEAAIRLPAVPRPRSQEHNMANCSGRLTRPKR